ncbi:acyl-CoA dehydrogenase [Rhodococcus sp. WS4]|nr:acyl-CoA dehydrogenase [Rhodococcus sp. WS4]
MFDEDPEFERELSWVREFMQTQVWPLEVLDVEDKDFEVVLRVLQQEVKARRLWAAHLPPELGGQGLGQVKLAQLNEIIGSSFWGPYVFGCQAPDSGNAEILALVGTSEQKDRWLYPLLDGRIWSAFSMTEPANAGSDPTQMSTTAVRDGDDWVINGHKWFSSNAMAADFLIVMAVTDQNEAAHRRASMFIVPKDAPGLEVVRNVPTMIGPERLGFGHPEVRYDNCRVDSANILGGVGDGFKIAQMRLGPGRIHHCMRWLGQAGRAFDIMCERAVQRTVRGRPLADSDLIQSWIAESKAEMDAARLLTLKAAWVIDTQGVKAAKIDIAVIKYFGAEVLNRVLDRAMQVNGALGFSGDLPLEHMYRRARAARFVDGADEVHKSAVARQILKNYRAPEGMWPTDHIPTRRAAAADFVADVLARSGHDH